MNDIEKLNSVKFNIRKALESQGSDITADTPFEEYPSYIMGMSGVEPTGTIMITENGTVDVSEYAQANVDIPASAVVSGTKNISSNGEHDVTNYESAKVNVPASAVVSGTKSVTKNGTVDVTNYAQADVNVQGAATYKLTISNQLSNTSLTVHGPFYDEYTGVYNTQWPLNSSPMTKDFYVNRKSNGGQLAPTNINKYINIVLWAQTPTNIPSGKKVKVSTDSGTLKIADIQNTAGNYYEACIVVKNMDKDKALTFEFEDA